MTVIELRPARADDAVALAGLARRSFRSAFESLLPRAALDAWAVADRETARYASEWPAMTVAVARDGALAGVVHLVGDEVNGLWVDPACQGQGIGAALLSHAESSLREAGSAKAWLSCSARNGAARAFYERQGYTVGRIEQSLLPDGSPEQLLIMEKPI